MNKAQPVRRCVGCGERFDKRTLLRIVKSNAGEGDSANGNPVFMIDDKAIRPGRGAYLCKKETCLAAARKKNAFHRSFHMAVPDALYEEIEKELAKE